MKSLAVCFLVIAGSVAWMAAPSPSQEYKNSDCIVPRAPDPRLISGYRAHALTAANELREQRALIYGPRNRFESVWYGLVWNLRGLGVPLPEPTFTQGMKLGAEASVKEFALVWDAAKGLEVNVCAVQRMVPQVRTDSANSAEEKLGALIAALSSNVQGRAQ